MVILLAIDPTTTRTGWAIFPESPPVRESSDVKGIVATSSLPLLGQPDGLGSPLHWQVTKTGVIIAHDRARCVQIEERIVTTQAQLDLVIDTWHPAEIACGRPSIILLPGQKAGMDLLVNALDRWSKGHGLPLYPYLIREIRTQLLGRSKSAKEELAYAVMTRWGLLGELKTTHEWNAIVVGDYHLGRRSLATHSSS